MSNRTRYGVTTRRNEVVQVHAALQGGGAAENMTVNEPGSYEAGDVVSATYTATGTFTIVFRHAYPQLVGGAAPLVVGTTAGMQGRFTAVDPVAKTATLKLEVGDVATDPALTDFVYLNLLARNSGRN
jgi:hypothetical protein